MGLISFLEAAKRTGTSIWTWRKWSSQHKISTVRIGRRRLVDEAVVAGMIRAGTVEADDRISLPGAGNSESAVSCNQAVGSIR